ncbi:11497_t:CDS:2 [Funneliformis caledonium]|uniref:11497_t:CDS:1 n=1 Tax=Funneliformis caledonium TaxID=1117310 RepID=A0A9N8Z0D8_9GLOM|nr:11497_t:CDS:2 [Funneliformis caledonium]
MANLSDTSYLVRLEPRSLFTYTFLLALLVQLAHDVIIYYIQINEGYFKETIVEMPESAKILQLNKLAKYLDSISISFTMLSGVVSWKKFPGVTMKAYVNIGYIWFPIIAYVFDALIQKPKILENVPRLSVSVIALILCFVGGLRVNFEVNKLLNLNSRHILNQQDKLKYFGDLNIWFNFALFIWSASYIILSFNGLVSLKLTRFISDILIAHVNFGGFILYICIILIVYPDFTIEQKPRAISTPFDVSKPNNGIDIAEIIAKKGPSGVEDLLMNQIIVETRQDVKVEQAYINPYRSLSTTLPATPSSSNHLSMDSLAPMPSPSSTFAGNSKNKNQLRSSPLNDASSQQTLDEHSTLTDNGGRFEDDESWQQVETLNESQFQVENNDEDMPSTFGRNQKSSSSDTEEESKEGSPRSMNPGETCCAIHLEITVKQFPSSLPFGWRTKEYIPTISFPDENACDVKQAKFGMGMIMGYKLSPCTDVLADDIFRLRISNNKNSKGVNGVNLSERGKDDINSSGSNSSGDVTVHSSVAPCNGIELIYLKVPGKVLLELVDALDSLAGSFLSIGVI